MDCTVNDVVHSRPDSMCHSQSVDWWRSVLLAVEYFVERDIDTVMAV